MRRVAPKATQGQSCSRLVRVASCLPMHQNTHMVCLGMHSHGYTLLCGLHIRAKREYCSCITDGEVRWISVTLALTVEPPVVQCWSRSVLMGHWRAPSSNMIALEINDTTHGKACIPPMSVENHACHGGECCSVVRGGIDPTINVAELASLHGSHPSARLEGSASRG